MEKNQLNLKIPESMKSKLKSESAKLGVTMTDLSIYLYRNAFYEINRGKITRKIIMEELNENK